MRIRRRRTVESQRKPGSTAARLARSIDVAMSGVLLLLLFAAAPVRPVWADGQPGVAPPTVILISLDGTRPSEVRQETLPSLVALVDRGAVAERLIPVVPANTFPNHVTLVTGVSPERHGVVNNVFRDAEKGVFEKKDIPDWVEVEPLWSLLEGEGIATAAYYWVGSEGAWRSGQAPRHWRAFSSKTGEMKKVEQILAWLDLPQAQGRPRFISSWFHGADHAGHRYGPGSPEVQQSLLTQDPAIGRLVEGLDARGLFASTTLIVVSDHGMLAATRQIDLGSELEAAGIRASVFGIGGFASVALVGSGEHSSGAIDHVVAVARGLGLDALRRLEAPSSLRVAHPRFGDVVVRAPVGTAIVYGGLRLKGFHGYDPEHPDMAALFVAAGRGVVAGTKLPPQRSLDVAPTVLALLGVRVPGWMEGRPIEAIVPQAAASATLPAVDRR